MPDFNFLRAFNDSLLDNVVGSCPIQLLQYDAATLLLSTKDISTHSFLKNQKRLYKELQPQTSVIEQQHALLTSRHVLSYSIANPDTTDSILSMPTLPKTIFDLDTLNKRNSTMSSSSSRSHHHHSVQVTSYDLASSYIESSPYKYALIFSRKISRLSRPPSFISNDAKKRSSSSIQNSPASIQVEDSSHYSSPQIDPSFSPSNSNRRYRPKQYRHHQRRSLYGSNKRSSYSSLHFKKYEQGVSPSLSTSPTTYQQTQPSTLDAIISTLPHRIPWLKYHPSRVETVVILFNQKRKRKVWKRCLAESFDLRVLNLNKVIYRAPELMVSSSEESRSPKESKKHSQEPRTKKVASQFSSPADFNINSNPYRKKNASSKKNVEKQLPPIPVDKAEGSYKNLQPPVLGMGIHYRNGDVLTPIENCESSPKYERHFHSQKSNTNSSHKKHHRHTHSNTIIETTYRGLEDMNSQSHMPQDDAIKPLKISKKETTRSVSAENFDVNGDDKLPESFLPAESRSTELHRLSRNLYPPVDLKNNNNHYTKSSMDNATRPQKSSNSSPSVESPDTASSDDAAGFSYLSPQTSPPSLTSSPSPSASSSNPASPIPQNKINFKSSDSTNEFSFATEPHVLSTSPETKGFLSDRIPGILPRSSSLNPPAKQLYEGNEKGFAHNLLKKLQRHQAQNTTDAISDKALHKSETIEITHNGVKPNQLQTQTQQENIQQQEVQTPKELNFNKLGQSSSKPNNILPTSPPTSAPPSLPLPQPSGSVLASSPKLSFFTSSSTTQRRSVSHNRRNSANSFFNSSSTRDTNALSWSSRHRPESIRMTPQDLFDQELAQLAMARERFTNSKKHSNNSISVSSCNNMPDHSNSNLDLTYDNDSSSTIATAIFSTTLNSSESSTKSSAPTTPTNQTHPGYISSYSGGYAGAGVMVATPPNSSASMKLNTIKEWAASNMSSQVVDTSIQSQKTIIFSKSLPKLEGDVKATNHGGSSENNSTRLPKWHALSPPTSPQPPRFGLPEIPEKPELECIPVSPKIGA